MKPPAQALHVAVLAAALAGCAVPANAQSQVSLLIGTTPGGGYDVYARALARHIGRHLPGRPTVIAKNVPGAGGLTLANYLYNRAPADGSELATVQNGLPFEKLFQTLSPDGRNALFDATKFGWIGSITQTVFVTVTWHTSAVKTLKDATTQQTILGASATSSDSYVLAMLTNRLLDTRFKVVHSYPGAAVASSLPDGLGRLLAALLTYAVALVALRPLPASVCVRLVRGALGRPGPPTAAGAS